MDGNTEEGRSGESLQVEEVPQKELCFLNGAPKGLNYFHPGEKTLAVRAREGVRLEAFQGFFHLA